MVSGWRYRVVSVGGAALVTTAVVALTDQRAFLTLLAVVPVLGDLPVTPAETYGELAFEIGTTLVVVLAALVPLFKPQPRRILDTITLTQKRILLATFALATIGYFDYTYRLPRLTLILTSGLLFVLLPAWFVAIRRRPRSGGERAVIVGDDAESIEAILSVADVPILGYVFPPSRYDAGDAPTVNMPEFADGGVVEEGSFAELTFLGGLSRLDDVFVEYDVDTAILAFSHPDRAEFFGTLDTCYDHGVTAKVHREHADVVLTTGVGDGELVEVDLEPWDWQDYVIKRLFDVGFSIAALLVLSPIIVAIAAAIKLDSPGPALYRQERTAELGETFTVYKFRSMVQDAEAETGAMLSDEDRGEEDPRVTRVGRVLRKTHLDEIPQLWSILVGDMSVVGPRPERPELDSDIGGSVDEWSRRWFVKPGLTGLAQIRGATGYEPEEKLRYDIEYIRRRTFWFDVKVVIRQLWLVFVDVLSFARSREER